jgi:hypothetical protein
MKKLRFKDLRDLKDLSKDDVLQALGLQTRPSAAASFFGGLGTFGLGLLAGAGLALLMAPKPGRELREDLRDRISRNVEKAKGTSETIEDRIS